ncbi:MAG: ribosome silencing factor [Prevotella sp.]|jgi:ribosome-associated protein|uniref:Ribosomal silencing factor RsfS n=1 Tax=Segatella cerevisiae TaxID=2053716 RepID=A0ABT1BV65_9BACT|nr:ribosome silencing factor [Segatella cerevisiae]MCH3993973.1 ribosome silencing factor [Prevotella sp.]MCI1247109.1 ribosome silencing factor [Prevotella sp.]MCO6024283.1 ribosome silencing factor [Segatella cerevisiae]
MEETKQLVETIITGIQNKRGAEIVMVDLTHIEGAIANYFIICQGNSSTQVEAIAESVSDITLNKLHEKPFNVAGLGNDEWVALDFVDVMVHIFQPEPRKFYNLEDLWDDAPLIEIPSDEDLQSAVI